MKPLGPARHAPTVVGRSPTVFPVRGRGRSRVLETDYVIPPLSLFFSGGPAMASGRRLQQDWNRKKMAIGSTFWTATVASHESVQTSGTEGWIEQRYLVTPGGFSDGFQKLAQQSQNNPGQAVGVTRNDTNLISLPAAIPNIFIC